MHAEQDYTVELTYEVTLKIQIPNCRTSEEALAALDEDFKDQLKQAKEVVISAVDSQAYPSTDEVLAVDAEVK
jgi:hypothetical protein